MVAHRDTDSSGGQTAAERAADDADLLDGDGGREKSREAAIARLRDKFGAGAVERGLAFTGRPRR